MRRAALLLAMLVAAPAARAGEGVYITIDAGYAQWGKDALSKNLPGQVGATNTTLLLDQQMPDGVMTALHLGFNIAGHVALEGSIGLHPWSPLSDTRGAVFLGGAATRWYPLQGLLKPSRQYDISLLAGVDYALMGGGGVSGQDRSSRGFDGMAFEFGATLEAYPAKWVSIGVTPRLYEFHPLRYFTDYNNRDKGGEIPLTGNVGGSLFTISLSITFHFEPLPE